MKALSSSRERIERYGSTKCIAEAHLGHERISTALSAVSTVLVHRRRKRGGGGGDRKGQPPPNNLRGGANIPFAPPPPPNNPPTFSLNFYLKQEENHKCTKLKGKIIINVTLI